MTAAIQAQAKESAESSLSSSTSEELAASLDAVLSSMTDEDVVKTFADYMPETVSDSTLKDNLKLFGQADRDDPSYVLIYADTFASKDEISSMISDYTVISVLSTAFTSYKNRRLAESISPSAVTSGSTSSNPL